VRLTRLEVASFRGYNRRQSFDCLADVVILHGPNGAGKTSFFDAIAWALFGDITRLRGSRDVVGDAHIQNYFSDAPEPQVSLHLSIDDRTALVTRQKSGLFVVDGGIEYADSSAETWIAEQFKPAIAPQDWSLADAERRFLSAHSLGQEEVAAFLRSTNPRDRFDALASLLGVDLVRRFFAHTTQVDKTAQDELRELESRIQSINQRLEQLRVEQSGLEAGASDATSPTMERLMTELREVAARASSLGITTFLPGSTDLVVADILSAAQELRAVGTALVETMHARVAALQQIETGLPEATPRSTQRAAVEEELIQQRATAKTTEATLAATTGERQTVRRRLAEVRAAIDAAKPTANGFASFLLSAEAFVQGNHCPVCEQAISPDNVRSRLRERANQVPESLRALEHERQELEARERDLGERIAELQAILDAARGRIATLEEEQGRFNVIESEWQSALASAGLATNPDPAEVTALRQLEATRSAAADQLVVDVDAVLAKARYLSSQDRRSRLADEEAHLRREQASLAESVERMRKSRALLQAITSAAKESELEIVRRLMLEQKPLLNGLYRRLRPHPVLDQLEIEFGQFSQRGEVYFEAVAGEKRANVSAIFSSAQLNAVAICVFLATNVSAGGTRFALLDDPIQNMDDFNVLGLLDLLRSVASNRQVILSTHDTQLGELMRRKLRPLQLTRRTITHEFIGYDELGPQVVTRIDEFSEAPELLPALVA
jgi:DNA repair exonuclease SbcCD ATPase subunit